MRTHGDILQERDEQQFAREEQTNRDAHVAEMPEPYDWKEHDKIMLVASIEEAQERVDELTAELTELILDEL